METLETLYFSWERTPAVIVDVTPEKSAGFILPITEVELGWREATPDQVKDFFVDGSRLSKSEFEKTFGIIGADLPELPAVT